MYAFLNESEISARLEQAGQHTFYEEPFPQYAGRPPRAAAVLVPLTLVNGEWRVLYTRRTDIVEHHKGQVSFPGGASDPGDADRVETALREAEEEVGLLRGDVKLLGQLGEMRTVTNFMITPVVGVFPWPYAFKIHTIEVDRVFMMPLKWLADRNNWNEFVRKESQRGMISYYPYDSELLWGVTARITVEFIRAIGLLPYEA